MWIRYLSQFLLRTTFTPGWILSFTQRWLWPQKWGSPAFAALCGLCLFVDLACMAPAAAQGRLRAQYEATLAGVSIGKANLNIEILDDRYSATVSGSTVGLVKYFGSYTFSWSAWGRVENGSLVPTYSKTTTTVAGKTEEVRIMFARGNVKEFGVVPEPPVDPARIPVTDAHRHGVLDYLTSLTLHASGTGDLVTPEACHSSVAVFDGRLRYNRNYVFKRMEAIGAGRHYRGPVVVCAQSIVRLAGYTPKEIKEAQRDNEIAFAPVAGTRILVPLWMKSTTPFGPISIAATSFITEPQPRNPKTQ